MNWRASSGAAVARQRAVLLERARAFFARREILEVDRRLARFYALRLFHLLGFRREGKDGEILVLTRRQDLPT